MTFRHDGGNEPDKLEQPGHAYELTKRGHDLLQEVHDANPRGPAEPQRQPAEPRAGRTPFDGCRSSRRERPCPDR
jgi:hypothetical protein